MVLEFVGLAAIGAIVIAFLGSSRAAIITTALVFIGMILLLLFAQMARTESAISRASASTLIVMVTLVFSIFLVFTVTAFAFGWPERFARFLGIEESAPKTRPSVRALGQLSHIATALGTSNATFVVQLSNENGPISNFYVDEIIAPTWHQLFARLCNMYTCLECSPPPDQIKDVLRIRRNGTVRSYSRDGDTVLGCS